MLEKQEHLYSTLFTSGQVLVERHGPPEVTEALTEALRLQWSYGFPYTPRTLPLLTHAFGVYPAGMQAAAAHHLLKTVLPGRTVFDPFVGGGTVLVEAIRAGRLGIGSDISPLALFVARGRTWTASDLELEELCEASRSVCAAVAKKLGDTRHRQVSGKDWELFRSEIRTYLAAKEASEGRLGDGLKDGLWFLFAVAGRRAAKARRRQDNGNIVAHRFFHSMCVEYISAIKRLTAAAISVRSKLGRLSTTSCGGGQDSVFLDPVPSGRNWGSAWTVGELGARSEVRRQRRSDALSDGREAFARGTKWENDQKDWLLATTRALRAGGRLGIMIGNGDGINTRSSLLRTVAVLGKEAALEVVGWVTLRAAAGTRRSMRTEHLVLLERS
eukprot:g4040.t2